MRLLVISGLSGSGKSIALQALEDLDYYCVDNLPLSLLPQFVDQIVATAEKRNIENVAVGIDARNLSRDLGRFGDILNEIRKPGINCDVIFLGAADHVLIKRFSETRRKHPLTRVDVSLLEAIAVERESASLSPSRSRRRLLATTARAAWVDRGGVSAEKSSTVRGAEGRKRNGAVERIDSRSSDGSFIESLDPSEMNPRRQRGGSS